MMPSCEAVRSWLPAYLDGERGPLPAEAIEQHVARCAVCAAELSRQRRFSSAVQRAYRPEPVPPSLARAVRRPSGGRVIRFAAAAVVMLASGLAVAQLLASSKADARSLPEAAVMVHEAVRSNAMPLDVVASDQHELALRLGERLPFRFHLPAQTDPGLTLKGGRVMQVGNSLSALVVYERGDQQVSLAVAPRGTALGEPGQHTELFRKMRFHSAQVRGYSVISWDDGELSYALVAPSLELSRASCAVCHAAGAGLSGVDDFHPSSF